LLRNGIDFNALGGKNNQNEYFVKSPVAKKLFPLKLSDDLLLGFRGKTKGMVDISD